MIWYLLLLPALALFLLIAVHGVVFISDLNIAGKKIKAYLAFAVLLSLIMGIVISTGFIVGNMSTPVLYDSVYDKIAIEMFYKS